MFPRVLALFSLLILHSSLFPLHSFAQTTINMGLTQNPLFSVSTNSVSATLDGTPLTLGADVVITGGSGNYAYRWYVGDTTLSTSATYTVGEPGDYLLDISDECDCTQTVEFHITGVSSIASVTTDDVVQVVIFTEAGVLAKVFNSSKYDSSALNKGVYIVNKIHKNGNVSTSKVLIK